MWNPEVFCAFWNLLSNYKSWIQCLHLNVKTMSSNFIIGMWVIQLQVSKSSFQPWICRNQLDPWLFLEVTEIAKNLSCVCQLSLIDVIRFSAKFETWEFCRCIWKLLLHLIMGLNSETEKVEYTMWLHQAKQVTSEVSLTSQ